MSKNLSKIGLEASKFILDNNCGEYLNRKLFYKIKKIVCHYTEKSILALFPFYEQEEYDTNINKTDFFQYFKKNFNNQKQNLPFDFETATIDLDDGEYIQSIDVVVSKNPDLNENQIYALKLNTNLKSTRVGKKNIFTELCDVKSESFKEYVIKTLHIEGEFIIGFKLSYENEKNSEYNRKIPHLSFLKIYTEKNSKKENYLEKNKDKMRLPINGSKGIANYFSCFTKYFLYFLFLMCTISSLVFAYYYSSQNILKGLLILDASSSGNILDYPTKLHTDDNGFVHIKAETMGDAIFTLGIAHARDRLFQMDFMRRLSLGKLSEVLGEKALKIDKFMRSVGISRVIVDDYKYISDRNSEGYDENAKQIMEKYVLGINYYANKHFLAPEFYILNFKFQNWTAYDSFALGRFQAFSLSLDWPLELFNTIFEETFGKDFNDMLMNVSYDNFYLSDKTVLTKEEIETLNLSKGMNVEILGKNTSPKEEEDLSKTFESVLESQARNVLPTDLITGQASNSWAISGNYTSSGKPIFSNDPHLKNVIPGLHYIVKLYIGNITNPNILVGSAMVGTPFVLIGSNNYISWGITTDNRDNSDICEEKLDQESVENSKYYFVGDEKFELGTSKETIKIKGKESYEFIIKWTRNGVIIEEFIKEIGFIGLDYKYKTNNPGESSKTDNQPKQPNAVSLRFSSYQFHGMLSFFLSVNSAKSKEDFLPKLENYPNPLLAFLWASVDGEIGYTPIGKIPLKNNKESKFCKGYLKDSLSNDLITGFIPRNETPVIVNPDKGFIVTANNRQMPDNYLHYSPTYAYFYRFERISNMIDEIIHKENKKFDINDNKNILSDVLDINCQYVLPKIVNILERNFEKIDLKFKNNPIQEENIKNYLQMLKNFDCRHNKNSTASTVYSVFEYHLGVNLLLKNEENNVKKGFTKDLEARAILNNFNYWNLVQKLIESTHANNHNGKLNSFENCKFHKASDTCEGYIISTFEKLDDYLIEYKNEDGSIKEWSQIHFHHYPHVFDNVPILNKIFSRKIPTDGNRYTVKVSKNKFDDNINGPFTSTHSANLKFISDLSDITCPYIIIDTGNSGNVLSKFYDNLIEKSERNELIKIKNHSFNDDNSLLISFPEHNTLIIRNK